MPGFGYGPFGQQPFGEWAWSKQVLWDTIPSDYREQDAAIDGGLESLSLAFRSSFDNLRQKIRDLGDLRDPFAARTKLDTLTYFKLGRQIFPGPAMLLHGADGQLLSANVFRSLSTTFTPDHVGCELRIRKASKTSNNRSVRILSVLEDHVVLLDTDLLFESTKLFWELYKVPAPNPVEATFEIRMGDARQLSPGWTLSDGISDYPVLARSLFPASDSKHFTELEREGASVDVDGRLTVGTYLSSGDVGKYISISGSTAEANNSAFELVRVDVVSPSDHRAVFATPLTPDSSSLRWALYPYAHVTVSVGATLPSGVVLKEGVDLQILSTSGGYSVATCVGTQLAQADVLSMVEINNSTLGNNGTYQIESVSGSLFSLVGTLVAESGLRYEIRKRTKTSDGTKLEGYAQPLLPLLAKDFGLEVDSTEADYQQRSWVKNLVHWIDKKGTVRAYETLANINGFEAEVHGLFRIHARAASSFAAADLIEVGSSDPSTFGINGSLVHSMSATTMEGRVRFYSPTAKFSAVDRGDIIHTQNTMTGAHAKRYTIEFVVDEHTVDMEAADLMLSASDYGMGGTDVEPTVQWEKVRLYTKKPPKVLFFDDFDSDGVATVPPDTFDSFSSYSELSLTFPISEVVTLTSTRFRVTMDLTVPVFGGIWRFADSNGYEGFMETKPVLTYDGSGNLVSATFETIGYSAPTVLADGTLTYVPQYQFFWDYAGASKATVDLTSNGSIESLSLTRTLARCESATPLHVDLVPTFIFDSQAQLTPMAEIYTDDGEVLIPPTNLRVSSDGGATSGTFSWDPPVSGATPTHYNFHIQRGATSIGQMLSAASTDYLNTHVVSGDVVTIQSARELSPGVFETSEASNSLVVPDVVAPGNFSGGAVQWNGALLTVPSPVPSGHITGYGWEVVNYDTNDVISFGYWAGSMGLPMLQQTASMNFVRVTAFATPYDRTSGAPNPPFSVANSPYTVSLVQTNYAPTDLTTWSWSTGTGTSTASETAGGPWIFEAGNHSVTAYRLTTGGVAAKLTTTVTVPASGSMQMYYLNTYWQDVGGAGRTTKLRGISDGVTYETTTVSTGEWQDDLTIVYVPAGVTSVTLEIDLPGTSRDVRVFRPYFRIGA